MQSANKLIYLCDQSGAMADLDLAIAHLGDGSMNGLRVAERISVKDLDGAARDIEAWLQQAHADDRSLHMMLYALASIRGIASDPRGIEVYERALAAEIRHRYLFGRKRTDLSALTKKHMIGTKDVRNEAPGEFCAQHVCNHSPKDGSPRSRCFAVPPDELD